MVNLYIKEIIYIRFNFSLIINSRYYKLSKISVVWGVLFLEKMLILIVCGVSCQKKIIILLLYDLMIFYVFGISFSQTVVYIL